jgi:hypothetical protein
MPTIDVVRIEQLDQVVALAIQKVCSAVEIARKNGIQAELPGKLDFQMTVIAPDGWQSLEVNSHENGETVEDGETTEKGKTVEKGTISDKGTTIEKQGGFSTEIQTSGGTDRQTGTETRRTEGANSHVENGDSTTITEQS